MWSARSSRSSVVTRAEPFAWTFQVRQWVSMSFLRKRARGQAGHDAMDHQTLMSVGLDPHIEPVNRGCRGVIGALASLGSHGQSVSEVEYTEGPEASHRLRSSRVSIGRWRHGANANPASLALDLAVHADGGIAPGPVESADRAGGSMRAELRYPYTKSPRRRLRSLRGRVELTTRPVCAPIDNRRVEVTCGDPDEATPSQQAYSTEALDGDVLRLIGA